MATPGIMPLSGIDALALERDKAYQGKIQSVAKCQLTCQADLAV